MTQTARLPAAYIAERVAKGATFFGIPFSELTRDELIACAVEGWTQATTARADARDASLREFRALAGGARET